MITTATSHLDKVTFWVIITENTFLMPLGRYNTRHGVFQVTIPQWDFVMIHWIQWKAFRERSKWWYPVYCMKVYFPSRYWLPETGIPITLNGHAIPDIPFPNGAYKIPWTRYQLHQTHWNTSYLNLNPEMGTQQMMKIWTIHRISETQLFLTSSLAINVFVAP